MKTARGQIRFAAALVGALAGATAQAQQPPAQSNPAPTASDSKTPFNVLPGRWVRTEGGYVISIKSADAGGKLDATYANPALLSFSTAFAIQDGNGIRLFFELRAAGYNGSTYTLNYDAANDQLKGVYYQAVAKQRFEVVFSRVK